MSTIAGLQDFRQGAPPADIGVFQAPCSVMVFNYTFSGTQYICAVRAGDRGWVLVDYEPVIVANTGAVINAGIAAAGAGETFLAAGTYIVASDIVKITTSYAALIGEGAGTVIQLQNADNQGTYYTAPWFPIIEAVNADHVLITNLRVDGNDGNQTAGCQHGITLDNCPYGAVRGCWVENTYRGAGIRLNNGSDHSIAEENICYGTDHNAIEVWIKSDYVIIANNTVQNSREGIEIFNASDYCMVIGNTIGDVNGSGIPINNTGGTGIVVANNSIYNVAQFDGIYVYCDNTVVVGNTIKHVGEVNTLPGIYIDRSSNCLVVGNRIDSPYGNGIHVEGTAAVYSDDNIIIGNIITDAEGVATGDGIDITDYADNCIAIGNRISGYTIGIHVANARCDDTIIYLNNVTGNGTPITDVGTNTWINANKGNVGIYQAADYGAAWAGWPAGVVGTPANGTTCTFYNTNAGELNSRWGCYSNGAWVSVALA